MDFDHKKFKQKIPADVFPVLDELFSHGLVPILVGGSVRDFFLSGSPGKDWDIELSHKTISFNKSDWKDFGKKLSRFGLISFLPYEIIRLDLEDVQMEFSPPRIEHYRNNERGHSNFDAEFDFKLPFERAVQRRDFTINAMGICFHQDHKIEFLDPAQGLEHLNLKLLHPAGENFSKDPVRFLRAIRFSEKYHFSFSEELKKTMSGMHLDMISPAYVWSEMQKSGNPIGFLERLIEEKKNHSDLSLPLEISTEDFSKITKILAYPKSHNSWVVALEWLGINSENFRNYFSLGSDSTRKLARWAQSSKLFQKIFPEIFHGDFEVVRETPEFEKLFDWYFSTKQLLQKNPELPLIKMIEEYLPEWIHLYRFEAPKDVKHIDPPYRAKYQVWNLCQRL